MRAHNRPVEEKTEVIMHTSVCVCVVCVFVIVNVVMWCVCHKETPKFITAGTTTSRSTSFTGDTGTVCVQGSTGRE